jgi:hypothetical protein
MFASRPNLVFRNLREFWYDNKDWVGNWVMVSQILSQMLNIFLEIFHVVQLS